MNTFPRLFAAAVLAAVAIFPSLVLVVLNANSMAPGALSMALLCAVSLVLMGSAAWVPAARRISPYAIATALALVYWHAVASAVVHKEFDLARFTTSYIALIAYLLGACGAARAAQQLTADDADRAVRLVFLILLACAGLSVIGFAPFTPPDARKPVVFFSEVSHYALAFLPFLLYVATMANRRKRLAVIALGFVAALLLKSTTLLAGIAVIVLVLYRVTFRMVLLVAFGAALLLNLDYYAARLSLDPETANLSSLAYLQGWERAFLSIRDTAGWGVGFQQFGIIGDRGSVQEVLAAINAENLSLFDGGTMAAKLLGEFGVAGVLLLAAYVVCMLRSAAQLRALGVLPPAQRDPVEIFFLGVFIMYVIDIFVRGTGYFSGSGLLFIASLAWVRFRRSPRLRVSAIPRAEMSR